MSKLTEKIMTQNPCFRAGRKIAVKGLMLHSVGCPQPDARIFISEWNQPLYDRACVHAFIDGNDGTVYQTLPWNHRGWHCGSGSRGSANNTHIGVEMCEPACIAYTTGSAFACADPAAARASVKRTYEAAVELFAMLCNKYGLQPMADGVIISHKEGHDRGIASNHGDPEHLWDGLGMGYTMDGFRKAVKGAMESAPDKKDQDDGGGAPAVNYQVRVTVPDLNIRTGPGTNYKKTGECTGEGVFTIVEEKSGKGAKKGWGKLKSGAGWISLDYAVKVL